MAADKEQLLIRIPTNTTVKFAVSNCTELLFGYQHPGWSASCQLVTRISLVV